MNFSRAWAELISAKKISIFGLYLATIIFCIDDSLFFQIPYFKHNVLDTNLQTSASVYYSDGKYFTRERDNTEKMLFTGIKLENNKKYLIELDVDIDVFHYEPTKLYIDLMAPSKNHDLKEQEIVVTLDTKTKYKRIVAVFDSLKIPEPTLFRIFYYTRNKVTIGKIQFSRVTPIGYLTKYILFSLIIFISLYYLFQLNLREMMHKHLKAGFITDYIRDINHTGGGIYSIFSLTAFYFLFVIIRILISRALENPLIATDELAYKNMAYSYFKTGSFYNTEQLGFAAHVPNVLYQWVMSISFYFKNNFFVVGKIINSMIINSVIFPIYILIRNYLSYPKALLACFFVLLCSSMNYVCFFMVESLYLPLYIISFIFIYKSLISRHIAYPILSGVFLSLLMFTKLNAISLIISYGLVSVILFFIPSDDEKKKTYIFETLSYALLSFVFSFILLSIILKGEISFSIGYYNRIVKNEINQEILSFEFLLMMVAHISTFLFLYLIPLVILIMALFQSIKKRIEIDTCFLLLVLVNTLMLFGMVFKYTADIAQFENFQRLHARYYYVIYPLFIAVFFMYSDKVTWNRNNKTVCLGLFILIVIANFYYIYKEFGETGLLVIDHPELTWYLFAKEYDVILYFLGFFSILCIATFMILKVKNRIAYLCFLGLLLVVSNIGEIMGLFHFDSINSRRVNKYIEVIKGRINDQDAKLVLIEAGNDYKLNVAFWCPYDYERVYQLPHGSTINNRMITDTTQYLVIFGDYHVEVTQNTSIVYKDDTLSILYLS